VTSSEHHLHIASADGAPGFQSLVDDIATSFGAPLERPTLVKMNEYNADWDVVYPFSQVRTYELAFSVNLYSFLALSF